MTSEIVTITINFTCLLFGLFNKIDIKNYTYEYNILTPS